MYKATGIKTKQHFSIASLTAIQSAQKKPPKKLDPYRNQETHLLYKSVDWFLHKTSRYEKEFANKH